MRLVIADCTVDYSGRLDAHLPRAKRLLLIKSDGSFLVHSESGSYKPLNWMTAPATLTVEDPDEADAEAGVQQVWRVTSDKGNGLLVVRIFAVVRELEEDLGEDPGLQKDGVEDHLQSLLAQQLPQILGEGWTLLRREHPTPVGPVDLVVFDDTGAPVAIEVKRRGGIDGVEQLSRYLDLLGRQKDLAAIRGVFAAQEITRQARTLAEDRGIECLILDYDHMRGVDNSEERLF